MTIRPWKIVHSRKNRACGVFDLRTDLARSPRTGREHPFYVLESAPWVHVIPLTPENLLVLIRQYRHGIRQVTLEIPGGLVETRDTPEEAARRELLEETGYRAPELLPLGYVHPNPAILNNRCYSFLARGVYPAGPMQPDEKEDIEVILRPLEEIPHLIRRGDITHALVLAAFYRLFVEGAGRLPGVNGLGVCDMEGS